MPAKRATRTSSRRSTGQGTLSFGKNADNRVTKPTVSPKGKAKGKAEKKDVEAEQAEPVEIGPPAADDPLAAPTSKTVTVLGGRAEPVTADEIASEDPEVDDEEAADDAAARATSVAQIKAYWRGKEEARLAPRVHQGDLTLAEKVLREWDMSGQFGPCIGITRLRRWRRARKLGLTPPVEVLAVLLGKLDGEGRSKTSKKDVGGASQGVEQRAYVDLLMGNHVEVGA